MANRVIQGCFLRGVPTGTAVQPAVAGRATPTGRVGPPVPSGPSGAAAAGASARRVYAVDAAVLRKTGPGQPLPHELRAHMERTFNADFGAVRVHVGPQAPSIGAQAFAAGADLYFAPGQYQPLTGPGRRLIGHELAHVVQQRQGRVPHAGAAGPIVVQDGALEAEADRMAQRAAMAERTPPRAPPLPTPRPLPPSPPGRGGRPAATIQRMLSQSKGLGETSTFEQGYGSWLKQQLAEEKETVTKTLLRRLELAKQAIGYTRQKLSLGAANVDAQVEQSLNWNQHLMEHVEAISGAIYQKIKSKQISEETISTATSFSKAENSDKFGTLNLMASNAIAARKLKTGVCDHFAAVTFFQLRKTAEEDDGIYRVSVTVDTNANHAVVIIGDPGLGEQKLLSSPSSVVVDAWPTRPFAVRAQEWVYRQKEVTIVAEVAGGNSSASNKNHVKIVRNVFLEPYTYDNYGNLESSYRGIDELPGGNKEVYHQFMDKFKHFREKAEESVKEKAPFTQWVAPRKMWNDVDSLDPQIKQKLI
ncbi:DUF4157 domain-containing protein [Azospirillum sp. A39]|uniref:DUF4157 domain-containing protein n=1 Tax=Azospirillum sp. A39 TaxID=3462279 RepID=UPI004045C71E